MNEIIETALDVNDCPAGYPSFHEESGTTLIVLNEVLELLEVEGKSDNDFKVLLNGSILKYGGPNKFILACKKNENFQTITFSELVPGKIQEIEILGSAIGCQVETNQSNKLLGKSEIIISLNQGGSVAIKSTEIGCNVLKTTLTLFEYNNYAKKKYQKSDREYKTFIGKKIIYAFYVMC